LSGGTTEEFALPLAVLTDHERGTPPGHATPQTAGAKVALFAPEVLLLNVVEHLRDPATLWGMAILAQQHIGNQPALVVQHHQGVAREGRRPGTAPFFEAMLGGGQMMAIEDFALRAGQPTRVAGPQGLDHRFGQRSGVPHEGRRHPGFAPIALGVQGGGRHPNRIFVGLRGGMHGGRHPENDCTHQLYQRGKQ
jgi:hypothetical protein